MAQQISSREFSELTGISVSTVNRLLREGKIRGVKIAGKWKIAKSEKKAKAVQAIMKSSGKGTASAKIDRMAAKKDNGQGSKAPSGKKTSIETAADGARTFSVSEFSSLTYLTDYGVIEFLKKGRLQGVIDEKGQWRLGADNLKNPLMRHLIR